MRSVSETMWCQQSPSYRWYVLVVLLFGNIVNQSHRQLLAVILPAGMACTGNGTNYHNHEDCISITKSETGLLLGPVYSVPFVIGGIALTYIADRYSRSTVLTICIFLWSSTILTMAYANSFGVVLLLRMLLGSFQAAFNPIAYALLSEYFATSRRGIAFSIFHLGVYTGFGVAFVAAAFSTDNSWRIIWQVAASVGYVVAVSTIFLREPTPTSPTLPPRPQRKVSLITPTKFGELFKSRSYLYIVGAAAATMVPRMGILAWLAVLYQKDYNVAPDDYGPTVGVILIIAGTLSVLAGGVISDKVSRTGSRVNICTLSQIVCLPFFVVCTLAPSSIVSYVMLFMALLTGDAFLGVSAELLQTIVEPKLRARASMVYLGSSQLTGCLGPVVVGFAHQNGVSLGVVMASLSAFGFALSGLLFHLLKLELAKIDKAEETCEEEDDDEPLLGADTFEHEFLNINLSENYMG